MACLHERRGLFNLVDTREVIMKPNVGGIDRLGRIALGIVLLVIGLEAPLSAVWQIIALVVAAVALVTAVLRFCPANALLGINTSETEVKK
jgi:hypothetical protein